jgi:glycine cleavage system H protein
MNNILDDRYYSEEHEWAKIDGNTAIIGITEHAQHALGDVVYVDLPKIGTSIKRGAALGVVESVKAVSDVYAPMSGTITELNSNLLKNPEHINQDPYGQGWIVKISLTEPNEINTLLNAKAYAELLHKVAK